MNCVALFKFLHGYKIVSMTKYVKRAAPYFTRPNETVGLVPHRAGERFERTERKFYAALLLISQDLGNLVVYQHPLNDICALAEVSGTNTDRLKELIIKIRSFTMNYNNRDYDHWKPLGLVKDIGILGVSQSRGRPAILYWELDDIVKDKLFNPTGFFTKMNLRMVTKLGSGSSIALYEIAATYATNNYGNGGISPQYDIQTFIQKIAGERFKVEKEWRYFKRNTFNAALAEVNQITDLNVGFKEFKTHQKITSIQLIIHKKEPVTEPLSLIDRGLVVRIQALGIDEANAKKLVQDKRHSTEKLARQIEITSKSRARNPLLYLKAGLRENYMPPKTPPPIMQRVAPVESTPINKDQVERRNQVFADFLNKSRLEQTLTIDLWLPFTNNAIKSFYRTRGFDSRPAKEDFINYLLNCQNKL